jgi:hypothetical protein
MVITPQKYPVALVGLPIRTVIAPGVLMLPLAAS